MKAACTGRRHDPDQNDLALPLVAPGPRLMFLLWLVLFSAPAVAVVVDIDPPRIGAAGVEGAAAAGQPLTIAVTVEDMSPIAAVRLFYRIKGTQAYQSVSMNRESESRYVARVPATAVTGAGLEYFIEAIDDADNRVTRGSKNMPLQIALEQVSPAAAGAAGDVPTGPPSDGRSSRWRWVLGAVVVGAILAVAGGGDDGGGNDAGTSAPPTGTVTISAGSP